MNRSLTLVIAILFIAVCTLYGQEAPSPKAKGALVLTYLKRPVLPTTEDNPMQQSADEVYLLFIVGNQAAATLQRDAVVRDSVLYPGGSDACMIDLATGNYTRRDESTILGGPYLITGNRKYKWDLTDETKVIGGIESRCDGSMMVYRSRQDPSVLQVCRVRWSLCGGVIIPIV